MTDFELTNRYNPDDVLRIEQFHPERVISTIYFDAKTGNYYAKRFVIEAQTLKNKYLFIKEGDGNHVSVVTTRADAVAVLRSGKKKSELIEEVFDFAESIGVTGWKTIGTKVGDKNLKEIELDEPKNEDEENAPTLF